MPQPSYISVFPDDVWYLIFSFLPSTGGDRNSLSLSCKTFYRLDRRSRYRLFIGNCYSISPSRVVTRFEEVKAVTIKGKPHFADFNLVPKEWGGDAASWVNAMAEAWPQLEEIRFKRMILDDDVLDVIARKFRNLKILQLVSCEGFSMMGIAAVVANCRNLRELDLRENEVNENCSNWLSYFPESLNSLVSLNIACLEAEVNFSVLERLVSRCSNLRTLKLNHSLPLDRLANLLLRAPKLVELGTSRFTGDSRPELYAKLQSAFAACKSLRCLSGIWEATPTYLPTIYPICDKLASLNLSYAVISSAEIVKIVSQCKNLRRLWVLDLIEDAGLETVASTCKHLEELRVFPSDPYGAAQPVVLTENGLVSVSSNCPNLHSILYFCRQMTNSALLTVAKYRPNLIRFRLCIIDPHTPDHQTQEPLDTGFSSIVMSCKNLRRLSVSGLLTDLVFRNIGLHADKLEMLSVAFAGDTDAGLHYILSGCKSLKKLEIRDCPFGDKALLANMKKLETMRSLWMSSCNLSLGACKILARKMPNLNVEVIDEKRGAKCGELMSDDCIVEKLYVYRTLAGRRSDMPSCVSIL